MRRRWPAPAGDSRGTMNSLRKWLYRPRRDDKSLFAKFWYADDALNRVAAELDSFDGRKDPERCAALVSRLRSCQDKLLNVCNRMLDELDGPGGRASREFRQKFPDEIVTDNLGGQLWFGAECLAAGSSIMNKEFESEQMRPLAKAVTKTLEKVRSLIREQCLSPAPEYSEGIHENLKIFDRLFAEFEFSYVSCMVHVKTVKEYEIQQDVICLFSDTLQRAINSEMISQDMVDFYDPSLMFAIPRLAIVCGLLVFPNGPLNVDRANADFPELFRPFKNLLRKIRELLWTLTASEFIVLERLLCQLEEPTNLERKLQAVQQELEDKLKQSVSEAQAAKLDEKLSAVANISTIPCNCELSQDKSAKSPLNLLDCDNTQNEAVNEIVEDIFEAVWRTVGNQSTKSEEPCDTQVPSCGELVVPQREGELPSIEELVPSEQSSHIVDTKSDQVHQTVVEIDCSSPDIKVSPVKGRVPTTGQVRHRQTPGDCGTDCSTCSSSEPNSLSSEVGGSPANHRRPDHEESPGQSSNQETSGRRKHRLRVVEAGSAESQSRSSRKTNLRRRGAKKYPPKSGKDARARFKSSEDLIHRLYVCISGAADQLQTNFAGDFRSILKYVFVMNATVDDVEEEEEQAVTGGSQETNSQESLSLSEEGETESSTPEQVEVESPDSAGQDPAPVAPIVVGARPDNLECGEDALMNETEQSYLRNLPEQNLGQESSEFGFPGLDPRLLSTSPPAGLAAMPVYASNLDYHLGDHGVLGGDVGASGGSNYYQPEPTLMTIASGSEAPTEESEAGRSHTVEPPPAWIPDAMAPLCMGCGVGFSMVRRRHHCRSCGRVFCAKCSPNQVPLPRYGLEKPVRVCNRCYIYYMNPYEERTVHAYHVYSGTGHGSWGYSGMVS